MSSSTTVEHLSKAIGKATRSAKFCVAGCLPGIDPGIVVDGLGEVASEPSPPANWARPAEVGCKCEYCAELSAFLADPANEVGRIAASELNRQHLIGKIGQFQCDVKHALERKGSPYSLVLTKTRGSYERAVKRFEADRRLLRALPDAE